MRIAGIVGAASKGIQWLGFSAIKRADMLNVAAPINPNSAEAVEVNPVE
jgi:hypothetical protein